MNRTAQIASSIVVLAIGIGAASWIKYDDWFVLPKARRFVAEKLKDPASAQFRNDRLISDDWYCGAINAKNEMGGYVGYKRFISGQKSNVMYLEGIGMMGEESTAEVLLLADKVIARLQAINRRKAQDPSFNPKTESDADRFKVAREQVFEDHWKAICDSTKPK